MSVFDNQRYKDLVTLPGEHVPDIGMEYPVDNPYARLMPAPISKEMKFDETYPYLDRSIGFRIMRFLTYCEVFGPFLWINWLRYGVRFEGRDVLKKYRKQFKNGIVSVSNHCYRLDGMSVSEALRHRLWIPMLSDHLQGPSRKRLKYFGGIPLTDGSMSAEKKFNAAFDYHASHKGWIHVFPEARSWLFYKPLRPWKTGAFTWAYRYGRPILPISLSYRKRSGIHKLFEKPEIPLVTVRIGEPIFPDTTQPRKAEVMRLMGEAFNAVCRLGGIEHNSWPITWDEN